MAVSMKSILNMSLGSSLRDIHTLYKGVEKVLYADTPSLSMLENALNISTEIPGPRTHTHNFADWK